VLTPAVMEILRRQLAELAAGQNLTLSAALAELPRREKYWALEVEGTRHNIGVKYGILMAQLALALGGKEREEVLADLVELLAASRERTT
jgi:UTP--glucose-1-phosphate uridylyltransferase